MAQPARIASMFLLVTASVFADSDRAVLEFDGEYPLFGMVSFEVRPLLGFRDGLDTVRAKLAEPLRALAATAGQALP